MMFVLDLGNFFHCWIVLFLSLMLSQICDVGPAYIRFVRNSAGKGYSFVLWLNYSSYLQSSCGKIASHFNVMF